MFAPLIRNQLHRQSHVLKIMQLQFFSCMKIQYNYKQLVPWQLQINWLQATRFLIVQIWLSRVVISSQFTNMNYALCTMTLMAFKTMLCMASTIIQPMVSTNAFKGNVQPSKFSKRLERFKIDCGVALFQQMPTCNKFQIFHFSSLPCFHL